MFSKPLLLPLFFSTLQAFFLVSMFTLPETQFNRWQKIEGLVRVSEMLGIGDKMIPSALSFFTRNNHSFLSILYLILIFNQ